MRLAIIVLLSIVCLSSFSQTSVPVFNWKSQEISKGKNLQGMSLLGENSAVIAGFGGTFKITDDQGLTWNNVDLFNPKYNFNDVSIEGNVGYMVGRKTALVNYPANGEDNVYINGVLLKTLDQGKTWNVLDLSGIGEGDDPGLNPSMTGSLALDPFTVLCINDTDAMVFVQWSDIISGTKKPHSAVFRTKNGGLKWTAVTADLSGAYVNTIRRNESDIFFGGNKILMKASVDGDEITDLFPALSAASGNTVFVNDIRFFGNEMWVLAVTGVYVSTDDGATFTKVNGLTGGNDLLKLDSSVILNLGSGSTSRASIDGGITWTSCYPGKTCWEIPGIFNDSVYALASSAIFKIAVDDLKNGNYKWTTITVDNESNNLQKMKIFDEQHALLVGYSETVKVTSDKGANWTDLAMPVLFQGADYDFRSVASFGSSGYVSSRTLKMIDFPVGNDYFLNGLIYKTNDSWQTWKVVNTKNIGKDTPDDASKYLTMKGCFAMDNYTVECADENTAFIYIGWQDSVSVPNVVTKHSRVFRTTDGGDSWSPVTKDFGSSVVTVMRFSGSTGYLGGNKILLKTTDGGDTFTDLYPVMTTGTDSNLYVSSISIRSDEEVYFQTSNNKGVFVTKDGGLSFSKLNGVAGGLDFVVLDDNSFMALGSSSLNRFTNDGGSNWMDSGLGTAIYAAGKILNDSLYVLGKSNVYKIAISDLKLNTAVDEIQASSLLKVVYGSGAVELVSSDSDISRCMVYNVSGQLVSILEPNDRICRLENGNLRPGIYVVAASVAGKRFIQKVLLK